LSLSKVEVVEGVPSLARTVSRVSTPTSTS